MTTTRGRNNDYPPQITMGQTEPATAAEGDLWISWWYNTAFLRTEAVVRVWESGYQTVEPYWRALS